MVDIPRVRQSSLLMCSVASDFSSILSQINSRPFMVADLQGLDKTQQQIFRQFLHLHLKFMTYYLLGISCWMHLAKLLFQDQVRRLLFIIGLDEKPVASEYQQLQRAIQRAIENRAHRPVGPDIYDAAETDDYVNDFIANSIHAIQSEPELRTLQEACKGAYSELRVKDRYRDRLKKREVKARQQEKVDQDGDDLIELIELPETAHHNISLSDDAKEKLKPCGKKAPDIIGQQTTSAVTSSPATTWIASNGTPNTCRESGRVRVLPVGLEPLSVRRVNLNDNIARIAARGFVEGDGHRLALLESIQVIAQHLAARRGER